MKGRHMRRGSFEGTESNSSTKLKDITGISKRARYSDTLSKRARYSDNLSKRARYSDTCKIF